MGRSISPHNLCTRGSADKDLLSCLASYQAVQAIYPNTRDCLTAWSRIAFTGKTYVHKVTTIRGTNLPASVGGGPRYFVGWIGSAARSLPQLMAAPSFWRWRMARLWAQMGWPLVARSTASACSEAISLLSQRLPDAWSLDPRI